MSAYTPGPWRVLQPQAYFETHPNMLLIVSKGADIAHVFQNTWDDTAQADAKLMAAAPELAAALRDMMELREARIRNEVIPGKSELDVLNAARSALAKAGSA